MKKLLSIEKLYYDGEFSEMESKEAEEIRKEFCKVCLNPLFKDNHNKGREAESIYVHSISYQHKDGFIAGFRAAVSLLLDRAG